MATMSASCSRSATSESACASEGPIVPLASRSCAAVDSRVPSASREDTQRTRLPKRRATAVRVSPSSSRSEQTTRASSSGVSVRGGALASSNSRLCSRAPVACSTTTGACVAPSSRH